MFIDNETLMPTMSQTEAIDGLVVLSSLAEIDAHKNLWQDLDARSTAGLVWFQSYQWCFNWLSHEGHRFSPVILMLLECGRATAILPLMKGNSGIGRRLLRMVGEPHTQYGNILTLNGTLTPEQVSLFETKLLDRRFSDGFVCDYVPQGSPLEQILGAARRMARLDNQAMLVDLTRFETPAAYDATLSKNTLKNLRRRRKHLEELGGVTFEVFRPHNAGYRETVEQCVAMKQVWLKQTARFGSSLEQGDHQTFLSALTTDLDTDEGPLAFALSVAGKAVAIEIGFLQRGHYYSYMGAFDWNLRQHAPGRLQIHQTLCWLIEQGVQTMDLLANPTDYKRDIASRDIALRSYAMNCNLSASLYATVWTGWAKPHLKHAYAATPQSWRVGLNHVRKLEMIISA